MKIVSWNVNGIRAVIKKGFHDFLDTHDPDILCLQETKACGDTLPRLELPYPHGYFNYAQKKGYSGTAILSKEEPLSVSYGMGAKDHPEEGRVITAEFPEFFLVNVYTPNAQGELKRLPYREGQWDPDFRAHIQKLMRTKPVITCGDFNVAHQEIDLANPKSNRRNAGFTDEERSGFDRLLATGLVDTFRAQYPDKQEAYSWWSYRAGARERNVGWRIDYVLVSEALKERVEDAFILDQIHGSDHAPVGIEMD